MVWSPAPVKSTDWPVLPAGTLVLSPVPLRPEPDTIPWLPAALRSVTVGLATMSDEESGKMYWNTGWVAARDDAAPRSPSPATTAPATQAMRTNGVSPSCMGSPIQKVVSPE